jgi:hypothetical protein
MDTYEKVLAETQKEFPDFKLVPKKKSCLMKVIDVCLRIITLNMQKSFLDKYITTLGCTVYTPSSWMDLPWQYRTSILRHERVHMRQSKKYTRLIYSLAYLFWPVPTVFAWFRKSFELEAYEETMRADLEYRGPAVFTIQYEEWIISQFTSAAYFWTWPWKSSLRRWYKSTMLHLLEKLI